MSTFEEKKSQLNSEFSSKSLLIQNPINLNILKNIQTQISQPNTSTDEQNMILSISDHQQLKTILDQTSAANDPQDCFEGSEAMDFFFEELLALVVNTILSCQSIKDAKMKDTCDNYLRQIALLWIKTSFIKYPNLTQAVKQIFTPTHKYYQITSTPYIFSGLPQDYLSWIKTLKAGDYVDCLKTDPRNEHNEWFHAQVIGTNNSYLHLSFLNDLKAQNKYLKISASAHSIAPYKSKFDSSEWRHNIHEGDEVDVDTRSLPDTWHRATIQKIRHLNLNNGTVGRALLIGYRTYSEDGNKLDSEGRRYSGYSEKYDEWICSMSLRLSPKLSDSCEDKKTYVVVRKKFTTARSFIDFVNKFGQDGGFNMIFKKMQAFQKSISEDVWSFARDYMHGRSRENFFETLDVLLERLMDPYKMNRLIRTFSLQMIEACINSEHIEEDNVINIITGLGVIIQCICFLKKIKTRKSEQEKQEISEKPITLQLLDEFIRDRGLCNKIWSSKEDKLFYKHEIPLLCYVLEQKLISLERFGFVWTSFLQQDCKIRSQFFKTILDFSVDSPSESKFSSIVLKTKAIEMDQSIGDFIMEGIMQLTPQEVTMQDITFLDSLNASILEDCNKEESLAEFYLKLIERTMESPCKKAVFERSIKSLSFILNFVTIDTQYHILDKCVENIKEEKMLIDIIKTLQNSRKDETDFDWIDYLIAKKDFLDIFFARFYQFKTASKERIQKCPEDIEDYNSQMTGLFYFLQFVVKTDAGREKIHNYIAGLWNESCLNSLTPDETMEMFYFIEYMCDQLNGTLSIVKVLSKIFEEEVLSDKRDAYIEMIMSPNGINCFVCLFQARNIETGKIYKGGPEFPIWVVSRVCVTVLPNQLDGYDKLWDFIELSQDKDATDTAIDFLMSLHKYLPRELELEIIPIRQDYVQRCFDHLKQILNNKNNISEVLFIEKCRNFTNLISQKMYESETRGIGKYKPHSDLFKKDLIRLKITNEASNQPQMIDLDVFSNTTVIDLRKILADRIEITWDLFNLRKNGHDIPDNENGWILSEFGTIQSLKCTKQFDESRRVELLQDDNTLEPRVQQIFTRWFLDCSDDGRMNPEQCLMLWAMLTGGDDPQNGSGVKKMFMNHDDDQDGYLILDNFIDFYREACESSSGSVWKNLKRMGERDDLQTEEEVLNEQADVESLIRYMISSNKQHFQLLFSLLSCKGVVSEEAWKIVDKLSTDIQIFTDVVSLQETKENQNFSMESRHPELNYEFIYKMNIIEYLLFKEGDPTNEEPLCGNLSEDLLLYQVPQNWERDFIVNGGFAYLYEGFKALLIEDQDLPLLFKEEILRFMTKSIKKYGQNKDFKESEINKVLEEFSRVAVEMKIEDFDKAS